MSPAETFELITMGRVGVDIYPEQIGVPLEDVTSFGKFLGGSSTNVAVAASRLGHRAATITRTGDDPFGRFVHQSLQGFGVDDRWVTSVAGLPTPVVFCEIFPPDDFPLYFYRLPKAPDLQIRADELDFDAIREADVFWVTVTGLSEEPSREAHLAALEARGRDRTTVLDLDYRPMFWGSAAEATAEVAAALPHVSVAVGNREECSVAVGESEPEAAAKALHAAGVDLAIVKQGPAGVLGSRRGDDQVVVPPVPVDVVNGLGAGDAFGGALAHGLLTGAPLEPMLAPGQRRRVLRRRAARLRRRHAHPRAAGSPPMSHVAPAVGAVTPDDVAQLVRTRVAQPSRIAELMAGRSAPPDLVGQTGRLMLVAADHPARGVLRAGSDPLAMGDRAELLSRLVRALARPGVDGVLGTADIVEDLLLLGALDDKVVIGSMNRGGLAGTVFELDDRFTGYDARGDRRGRLPGRQDAAPHRPPGPRHRVDADRLRPRGRRPGERRVDGDGRAVPLRPRRGRARAQRSVRRSGGAFDLGRLRARPHLGPHLAQAARDRRHGAGARLHHIAGPAARRRGRRGPAGPAGGVGQGVVQSRRTRHGGRQVASLPARRRCRAGRRCDRGADVSDHVLRAGTTATEDYALAVSPETAGWAHSGLRVLNLPAGGSYTLGTGDSEVVVLSLSGGAEVVVDDVRFSLEGRHSVFDGPSDVVYAPRESTLSLTSAEGGRFALCSAVCEARLAPAYLAEGPGAGGAARCWSGQPQGAQLRGARCPRGRPDHRL